MKKFLSVLMIFTILIGSFSFVQAQSIAGVNDMTKFSGEEIFLGAVLGQGAFAENLKHLWVKEQYEHNNSEEVIAITNPIIAQMRQVDPAYFDTLEEVVYNKDYVKTKNILDEGATMFLSLFKEVHGEMLDSPDTAQPNAIVAYLAVAVSLVVVYSHAAGLTFYLAAAAVGPGFNSNGTEFDNEQLIYEVVEAAHP